MKARYRANGQKENCKASRNLKSWARFELRMSGIHLQALRHDPSSMEDGRDHLTDKVESQTCV
jgi:hypothetical protein